MPLSAQFLSRIHACCNAAWQPEEEETAKSEAVKTFQPSGYRCGVLYTCDGGKPRFEP